MWLIRRARKSKIRFRIRDCFHGERGIFRELFYVRPYFGPYLEYGYSGQVDRANRRSKIEVVSVVNDCDLRCLPRLVSKGNSRSVSVVILLSPSLLLPSRFRSPSGVPARNYRRIYKERRIYKPAKSGLSCSPRAKRPEIVEKYRKTGPWTQSTGGMLGRNAITIRHVASFAKTIQRCTECRRLWLWIAKRFALHFVENERMKDER